MTDMTEGVRREMIRTGQPARDEAADTGPRWTTVQLSREFVVTGFLAPFVVARRKSDGVTGTLEFVDRPRIYFNWKEDR